MTRPALRHVSRLKCCRRGYIDLSQLRSSNKVTIQALAEVQQRSAFKQQLTRGHRALNLDQRLIKLSASGMTPNEYESILRVGFITFLLHVEARIASSLGYGYYTIGPCGEELLSAIGLHLRDRDASALHYRHVGTSLMRAYKDGDYRKSVGDIILDRARGFTCSSMDPVTGGRHCAIGGTPFEYVVTSTLASQCTPAVGRAMGIALAQVLGAPSPFPVDGVSFVSLGEGSANNAHFLSAINLAEYACYNHIKVSDCSFKAAIPLARIAETKHCFRPTHASSSVVPSGDRRVGQPAVHQSAGQGLDRQAMLSVHHEADSHRRLRPGRYL